MEQNTNKEKEGTNSNKVNHTVIGRTKMEGGCERKPK